MKLRIAILSLVLLVAFTSASAAGFRYGAKAGLSLSKQDFQYTEGWDLDASYRSGWAAGAFAEWEGCFGFGVVAEILYVQKGMQLEEEVTGPDSPDVVGKLVVDQRVDYISVPLLLKKRIPFPGWSAYAVAGPRFDFMLDYDSELGFSEIYEDFSGSDVGMDVGVGVEFRRFLAEVRYSATFTKSYSEELLEVTNGGFLVMAGLRF